MKKALHSSARLAETVRSTPMVGEGCRGTLMVGPPAETGGLSTALLVVMAALTPFAAPVVTCTPPTASITALAIETPSKVCWLTAHAQIQYGVLSS